MSAMRRYSVIVLAASVLSDPLSVREDRCERRQVFADIIKAAQLACLEEEASMQGANRLLIIVPQALSYCGPHIMPVRMPLGFSITVPFY